MVMICDLGAVSGGKRSGRNKKRWENIRECKDLELRDTLRKADYKGKKWLLDLQMMSPDDYECDDDDDDVDDDGSISFR
ncbi:hypothetical protein PoB_007610200 [Plakobranchus ocellatus]|uniref:Uncharacterized protein n=1 Tax=Plakobranchus ocellatus TaxID=259542 RepID=A0AAV4DZY9_9GAST|nr:hypothetical protein PoB_007610200 [Plakobranchus ocellatus]